MDLKQNTLMIGLGNCGCKIAKMFGDEGYKTMFANGSTQDLRALGNIAGIYKLRGYDGFGGHRDRAMDCLQINEEFTEALENIEQDIIFLIFAAGGSTGSGLAPIVAQYLKDVYGDDKIICTVCVLPAANESVNRHKNAYEVMQELAQLQAMGMNASFYIDNNSSVHKQINKRFVTLLDSFLADDSWGEENNFDCAERLEMLSEKGTMILEIIEGDSSSQLLKSSIFAPIQQDKVCGNICVIHSDKYEVNVEDIIETMGRPLNVYEGYGAPESLIAVSGASFPVDYVGVIGKIAVEGQRERQRNMDTVKVLEIPALDFGATSESKIVVADDKSLKNRDSLFKLRKNKKKTTEEE